MTLEPNPTAPPLPEHPQLRSIALAVEGAGLCGEILDATWQRVYMSSEQCRAAGVTADEAHGLNGMSIIRRTAEHPGHFGVDEESGHRFWAQNAPIMRAALEPDHPAFDSAFAHLAKLAARVEPRPDPPPAWASTMEIRDDSWQQRWWGGRATFFELRLNDDDGAFVGVLRLVRVGGSRLRAGVLGQEQGRRAVTGVLADDALLLHHVAIDELDEAADDLEVGARRHAATTILVGQVGTRSRLEVTALGDEMNEAARIWSAATEGTALASKNLLERLSPDDAAGLGIDLDRISYRTVAQLEHSSTKAVRDAGSVPVTSV